MAAATILIVDDDRLFHHLLDDLLLPAGFRTLHAADGEEGLRIARQESPDLVLVDLVMPGLDGADVCRHLRSLPGGERLALLMMTSRTDLQGAVNPFQAGADDYVPKPIDGPELLARVRANLLKRRTLASLDQKAKEYRHLLELSREGAKEAALPAVLARLAEAISQAIPAVRGCTLSLLQEDGRGGYLFARCDSPDLHPLGIDLLDFPVIQDVMATGRHRLLAEPTESLLPEALRLSSSEEGRGALLVLPVSQGSVVFGVLAVRLALGGEDLSPQAIGYCQLVADLVARPLANARLLHGLMDESVALREAKRQVEEQLRITAVYQELFDNASEGLAAINSCGKVVLANRRALEIVGRSREQIPGLPFVPLLDRASLRRVMRWRGGDPSFRMSSPFDVTIRRPSGEKRLLSVSSNGLQVAGDLQVVAFRDVTEKRLLEGELETTRARLEEANQRLLQVDRSRMEFVTTATHELRLPVTIIHGYLCLLQESGTDNLTARQKAYLEELMGSGERIFDLVSSLLDLSRFEAGKMALEIVPGDLRQVAQEVMHRFSALAQGSGLDLGLEGPRALPAHFDGECIERVLVNLLDNALKNTSSGAVRLLLEEGEREVRVAVEDTGKGIPAERLSRIFEEFAQVGVEDRRRGSGLGLAICRKIIESHQGRIWAESEEGAGSRFFFTLPYLGKDV